LTTTLSDLSQQKTLVTISAETEAENDIYYVALVVLMSSPMIFCGTEMLLLFLAMCVAVILNTFLPNRAIDDYKVLIDDLKKMLSSHQRVAVPQAIQTRVTHRS
jgi:hypothetical protein